MEGLSSEKGIFIYSENLELKFMIQCLQALSDISPDTKVNSVECDDRVGGYKVCLANSEAKGFLQRRYLTVTDQRVCVYPLATCLMVHGININAESERDFIDTIQEKFGKVLHLERITHTTDQKTSSSHLVLLDIPEIESLNVFSRNGYPRMTVAVPSMCKTFKVSFWCRRCKKQGHSHQDCFERSGKANGPERQPSLSGENKIEMHSSFPLETPTRRNSSILEPTESFTHKLGKEVIMSTGLVPENELSKHESVNDKAKNISRIIDTLKKYREIGGLSTNSRTKQGKEELSNKNILPDKPDSSENNPTLDKEIKDEFESPTPKGETPALPDATSTTDDEIQILNETDHESRDGLAKRENTPRNVNIKSEPQSDLIPEDSSFRNTATIPLQYVLAPPLQQPRLLTPLSTTQPPSTFELSNQLECCIQQAYQEYRILDRRILDAFLIHVKKKSNPIRVAANYTKDVTGLKNQLQEILRLYYMTPQTGTKTDASFIKWLIGLVDRFDGPVARKRKPSSKGLGGPSSKK